MNQMQDRKMQDRMRNLALCLCVAALAACNVEAGRDADEGGFGNPTMNNVMIQSGQKSYAVDLQRRFAAEVPSTVNFAFNRSTLDATARAALNKQADFIRQFPEVRFRVFGYTDLVGTERYNKSLGMRRARAVVSYLIGQGISRRRVEAVVSYGETRPLIPTPSPERQNRRAVTQVSGFVQSNPLVLNGKYAEVIFREYVAGATQMPPKASEVTTATK